MKKLLILSFLLLLCSGCAYAPKGDPNYHDIDTYDMRTGGAYTPGPHEYRNGCSFFSVWGEIFRGERKIVW